MNRPEFTTIYEHVTWLESENKRLHALTAVRHSGCSYFGFNGEICPRCGKMVNHAMDAMIEGISSANSNWIPMAIRKPPDKEFILLGDDTKPYKSGIFFGQYIADVDKCMDSHGGSYKNATHWMPLKPLNEGIDADGPG